MLKFGNKEFRNLQEQVLKNMRDIQNIMQGTTVLAEFGIKVIGQVDTAAELPDPATYEGEYGDAYVVGTEEPYEYYIFTRAFEGQTDPSWFDLGIFPVPGPQGPQGIQGPVGPQGQTGATGQDGADAGFGTVSATATTLPAGSDATVSVVASGPNTEKSFAFTFGIPEGEPGETPELEWGSISGDLSDQTDLVSALQAKQNASNAVTTNTEQTISAKKTFANPVEFTTSDVTFGNGTVTTIPGTIRTDKTNNYGVNIPSTSSFAANKTLATTDQLFSGSYNDLTDKPSIPSVSGTNDGTNWTSITINSDTYDIPQGGGTGTVTDVEVDGVSVVDAQGVAEITMPDLSDYITDTELSTELADYTPTVDLAAVATSGDYDDLTNKPTIPAAVSGTDDGTNWTTLTIGSNTKNIPTGSNLFQKAIAINPYNHNAYIVFDADINASTPVIGYKGDINTHTNTLYIKNTYNWSHDATIKIETADGLYGSEYEQGIYFTTNSGNSAHYAMIPHTGGWTANKYLATTDQLFSGNYNDLTNKPTIPTATSDLTNDSGFITSSALSGYATETWVGNQGYLTSVSWSDVSNKPSFATVATSGDYDDLLDKPDLSVFAETSSLGTAAYINEDELNISASQVTGLAAVAHSGSYSDLDNTPDLSIYAQSSDLATVATTGDYEDLLNKPTIPINTSDLYNDSGYITLNALTGYATESWVGQQGYLTSVSWNDVSSKPTFATVATSGDYDDLLNKPSIPTVSGTNDGTNWTTITINSDTYSIPSGGISTVDWSDITNKPTFATVATTGDYDDLLNKPTIPTVPVQDVTVNGTSVVSSGTAAVSVPTSASTTVSASSETFTFTYADGTTTTKTFLTAITSATTTLS